MDDRYHRELTKLHGGELPDACGIACGKVRGCPRSPPAGVRG